MKKATMERLKIDANEALVFVQHQQSMEGWELISIPDGAGGCLVGVVHPHDSDHGVDFHEQFLGRKGV